MLVTRQQLYNLVQFFDILHSLWHNHSKSYTLSSTKSLGVLDLSLILVTHCLKTLPLLVRFVLCIFKFMATLWVAGNLCRCTGYRPILDGFNTFAKDFQCPMGVDCCKNDSKVSKYTTKQVSLLWFHLA